MDKKLSDEDSFLVSKNQELSLPNSTPGETNVFSLNTKL